MGLYTVFVGQDFIEALVGVIVPRPCVGEGLCLGAVFGADIVVNLVVIALGIERRIDVAKINRLIADKFPHNIKIVTVIEFVHGTVDTENVARVSINEQLVTSGGDYAQPSQNACVSGRVSKTPG